MPKKEQIRSFTIGEQSGALLRSWLILRDAHGAAKAFLDLFDGSVKGKKGTPTDKQQDLLRAMLVFASAGLDSMLKQLVRDYLPRAMRFSDSAKSELIKFVKRRLLGGVSDLRTTEGAARGVESEMLVRLLLSEDALGVAIEDLGQELRLESLQSLEQIHRATRAMGLSIPTLNLATHAEPLRGAIDARNMIVHEMDIDFESVNRKRKSRKRASMVGMANSFLETADLILRASIGPSQGSLSPMSRATRE